MKYPLTAGLFLLSLLGAHAQSTPPPAPTGEWKKIEITPHFWAEGACAADVNHDGKTDILSGPFWYAGPNFQQRHNILPATKSFKIKSAEGAEQEIPGYEGVLGTKNEYSENFLSYAYDFNGDGWADYLVMGFPGKKTVWYENPQGREAPWPEHLVLDVTDNESPMFVDLTGDGKPELLCMSNGTIGYAEADWAKAGEPWKWHAVSAKGKYQRFTHGIGYGDINGDGKMDILEQGGWWEQPTTPRADGLWELHPALFGSGGAQMYGYDVNGDGRTDVITSLAAHGYGLAWFEQTKDAQGLVGWTQHLLTGTPKEPGETGPIFSQLHAIDLVDMNGDGLKDLVTGKRVYAHGPAGDPEPKAPGVVWWFELQRSGGTARYLPHLIDGDSGIGTEVLATDVDGDGKPDVVVGNKHGVFVHLRVK